MTRVIMLCTVMLWIAGCSPQTEAVSLSLSGMNRLVLDVVHSWEVASPSSLRTAGFLDEDAILATTIDGGLLMYTVGEAEPRSIGVVSGIAHVLISDVNTGGPVSEVWNDNGHRYQRTPDGTFVRIPGCEIDGTLISVIVLDGAPFLVQRDVDRRQTLSEYFARKVTETWPQCRMSSPIPLPCIGSPPSAAATKWGSLFIACGDDSQRLIEAKWVDNTLLLRDLEHSSSKPRQAATGNLQALWHPLPLIALDQGFVRVVSDLRGYSRRFEFWDDVGYHLGTTEIFAPIGFVASLPSEHLLLGMRGGERHELVLFRWSWAEISL